MHRLLEFPVTDAAAVSKLRRSANTADQRVALGLALARAGCSYEASFYLRPTRKIWSTGFGADEAEAALAAQTWWNKTWREIAQAVQKKQIKKALALIGDNFVYQWDQPALLLHLASIAREGDDLAIAKHLLERVGYLADRGLPKMNMAAFEYAARAGLIDVLADSGDADAALAEYAALLPSPGNAMPHELLGARLLTLAGHDDAAMVALAKILVTARTGRNGFSREFREDFVARAPELDGLRNRPDWAKLLRDPSAYSKQMVR